MADEFEAAMFAAAQAGRSGEIAPLLEAANKDSVLSAKLLCILADVLRVAAANNHVDAVQALFAGRSLVEVRQASVNHSGRTSALAVAARHGHADVLQLLLRQWGQYGHSILAHTLLETAVRESCCNKRDFACVTRVLVASKADPTEILVAAATCGEASMVLTLLKAKADATADSAGEALHEAIAGNRDARNVIAALVRHNANVDTPRPYRDRHFRILPQAGQTLLSRVSGEAQHWRWHSEGDLQAVRLGFVTTLLRLKADVHGGLHSGLNSGLHSGLYSGAMAPILAAAQHSGPAVVEALLSAKSNVHYGRRSALESMFNYPHFGGTPQCRDNTRSRDRITHPQTPVATLLVCAKARVDDQLLRLACEWMNWSRCSPDAADVVRVLYRAHPVPAEARKIVLMAPISAEARARLETNAPVELSAELQVEPQVELQVEPQVETQVEPQVETQVEPQVETQVEPRADTFV